MYNGYVESQEAIKARWELMQKHAREQAERKQHGGLTNDERLNMALAIKRQQQI